MSTTVEKILNELQETGKATALIVADSLGLEPDIAVAMLNNQVKTGNVKCLNGFYSITEKGRDYSPEASVPAKTNKPLKPRPARPAKAEPVKKAEVTPTQPPALVVIWSDDDFLTLSIPTPESLTKQIRKHEANARRLKKLRATIRSLQRQNVQAVRHV
ncbi:hypothetical protein Rahaq_4967 (plasmid) [Rahnella aceris]|uniref:Uncharacterized protein n=1 Tax=Rahnella sp. (strain Y9602) TaxID=2703885 RepID=A0A0H3FH05_RAHSY|nr:hypothetical protein [Rahnella aceris]ADW76542.1 hypothetical protein Rahaq_4967 [Rahnella aceris]